jgi:hypothetical protein
VCDRANCVVARWRPHLHCRYFEVQNLVTERTKTGGSSFILKKSEERVDFNHVRSSTGMLTFIMKIIRWRTFFLSEVYLTILFCLFCLLQMFLDSWQKECYLWKLSTTTQTLIYKSWYIYSREAHRTRSTNPHDEWQISLCPFFPCLVQEYILWLHGFTKLLVCLQETVLTINLSRVSMWWPLNCNARSPSSSQ